MRNLQPSHNKLVITECMYKCNVVIVLTAHEEFRVTLQTSGVWDPGMLWLTEDSMKLENKKKPNLNSPRIPSYF